MITSIVIIVLSLALFLYWFRYSCLLILESRLNEEEAQARGGNDSPQNIDAHWDRQLAQASSLSDLQQVRHALDQDLRLIQNLVHRHNGEQTTAPSLESRLLLINYRLLQLSVAFSQLFSVPKALSALREMSRIVGYLAAESGVNLAAARG
jgi:hypothetical protein